MTSESVSGVGSWNAAVAVVFVIAVLWICDFATGRLDAMASCDVVCVAAARIISLSSACCPSSIDARISSIPLASSVRAGRSSKWNSNWPRFEGCEIDPLGVRPVDPAKSALKSPPKPGVTFVHCAKDASNSRVGVEAPYLGAETDGKSISGAAAVGVTAVEYCASRPENIAGSQCLSVRRYSSCRAVEACAEGVDIRMDVSAEGRERAMMMLDQRFCAVTCTSASSSSSPTESCVLATHHVPAASFPDLLQDPAHTHLPNALHVNHTAQYRLPSDVRR
jgi:hypothetical protein